MVTKYLPILRWKQGERTALRRLSPQARLNVTPLIVIFPDSYSSGLQIARQVKESWGTSKIFIDASYLTGNSTQHELDSIRIAGKAEGLHFVPALPQTASPDYFQAVRRMAAADNQGAGIRITLAQMTSAASWLPRFPFQQGETDLIVDLSDSAPSVNALGASVFPAFVSLHEAIGWRSVTLAGGSIPRDLTGYPVGSTVVERSELLLWQRLTNHGLNYALHFGDYTTIGPNASTSPIPGPVPINAKYTHALHFQILHGVRETGPNGVPRATQYRQHAAAILAHPGYQAIGSCWADAQVAAIGGGSAGSAGSPTTWVTKAVNRHIELTRAHLP